MNVKVKKLSPCERQLEVEVPWEFFSGELDVVYQEIGRQAQVPGFRKGKAPREMLEKHHAGRAQEEALRRSVERSLQQALQQEADIQPVSRPEVDDIKFEPEKPLGYTAKIEVAPAVKVGKYKGLSLTKTIRQTVDEGVEGVLKHLQDTHAQLKLIETERAAEAGDFLVADLTHTPKEGEPQTQKDAVIEINLEQDPEGVLKQLVGLKVGDAKTVEMKDETTVEITLKEIKQKEMPELTDEFAKTVGPYESLDALKELIRKDVQMQQDAQHHKEMEVQVNDQLAEKWSFDVPPSLVANQAKRLLEERTASLSTKGDPKNPELAEKLKALEDRAKMDALRQVKLYYITQSIVEAESLLPSEEEVQQRLDEMAQSMNQTKEALIADLQKRDLLEDVGWSIARKKVMDLIIDSAKITEVEEKENKDGS